MNRRPTEGWRAVDDVIWTKYDDSDEWVVWSLLSGEIHLMTAAAQRLWALALDQPRDAADLVVALASEAGRPVDDEFTAATLETLAFMDDVGLIRPVNC